MKIVYIGISVGKRTQLIPVHFTPLDSNEDVNNEGHNDDDCCGMDAKTKSLLKSVDDFPQLRAFALHATNELRIRLGLRPINRQQSLEWEFHVRSKKDHKNNKQEQNEDGKKSQPRIWDFKRESRDNDQDYDDSDSKQKSKSKSKSKVTIGKKNQKNYEDDNDEDEDEYDEEEEEEEEEDNHQKKKRRDIDQRNAKVYVNGFQDFLVINHLRIKVQQNKQVKNNTKHNQKDIIRNMINKIKKIDMTIVTEQIAMIKAMKKMDPLNKEKKMMMIVNQNKMKKMDKMNQEKTKKKRVKKRTKKKIH